MRFPEHLLPPRLLAEMMTTVPTGVPGFGYGLGLAVVELGSGRLVGPRRRTPGFFNVVFSTPTVGGSSAS
jgi:hypothetical protein